MATSRRAIHGPTGFLPPFDQVGQPCDPTNANGANGVHMTHFVPLQTDRGAWVVAYGNHRGEFIAVAEFGSLEAAYNEAAAMTLDATKRAICDTPKETNHGNRFLRRFA